MQIDNLDLKLEFLHQLLVIENARDTLSGTKFSKLLEGEFKGRTLRKGVEDLININDNQSNDYRVLLREIRESLLGS